MSDRNATTYNQPVGTREDGSIVILADTFFYSGDFHGATGVEVYPVYPDAIRDAMGEKRDYLREMCDDCDIHGARRVEVMNMRRAEYLDMRFEAYQDVPAATLAAAVGIPTPERFAVSSIGRMFPRAFNDMTVLPGAAALVDIILQVEAE